MGGEGFLGITCYYNVLDPVILNRSERVCQIYYSLLSAFHFTMKSRLQKIKSLSKYIKQPILFHHSTKDR